MRNNHSKTLFFVYFKLYINSIEVKKRREINDEKDYW